MSGSLPEAKRPLLKAALARAGILRVMEAHNPLAAMIASTAEASGPDGGVARFDGLWLSGFSIATSRALPDSELLMLERRLETIEEIAAVTDRFLVADGDTGGDANALSHMCRRLEGLGVSAVVVEDKIFPKRTSLADGVDQHLEAPEAFAAKLEAAKRRLRSTDFLVFARIEALIAGAGLDEALRRARIYLASAADGIVIHSKQKSPGEVFFFAEGYRRLQSELGLAKPLMAIPTTYNAVTENELATRGFSIVVYGNHQVRAAFAGMQAACGSILRHGRSLEADAVCAPLPEIFRTIGTG
ncbi:MAG: phosphoenolpyruvate mutase [Alphaproteobacteria bacterium]|nr:phosphoenolpyruvate mutase [Alphaproteobacteria bacterium]